MDDFAARLRQAMENSGLRANQVAERTGLSKARISQYVNGRYTPKWDGICRLAEVLSVSPAWLMGEDGGASGEKDLPAGRDLPSGIRRLDLRSYPMLGAIACGAPIFAYEDGDTTYVTAADTNADFCLIAKGDSMVDARIFDGDEVFIQQTDYVRNGEIAAVAVDDEATLKRVYYYPDEQRLVLKPENPAYAPLTFSGIRGCDARVYAMFNRVNGNMKKYEKYAMGDATAERLPLWIQPDHKIDVREAMNLMRDHYEGTAMDMTQDVGAGPFACPYRWRPMNWEVDGKKYVPKLDRPIEIKGKKMMVLSPEKAMTAYEIDGKMCYAQHGGVKHVGAADDALDGVRESELHIVVTVETYGLAWECIDVLGHEAMDILRVEATEAVDKIESTYP